MNFCPEVSGSEAAPGRRVSRAGRNSGGLFPRKLSAVYVGTRPIFGKGTESCISEVKAEEQNSSSLQGHLVYGHSHSNIYMATSMLEVMIKIKTKKGIKTKITWLDQASKYGASLLPGKVYRDRGGGASAITLNLEMSLKCSSLTEHIIQFCAKFQNSSFNWKWEARSHSRHQPDDGVSSPSFPRQGEQPLLMMFLEAWGFPSQVEPHTRSLECQMQNKLCLAFN